MDTDALTTGVLKELRATRTYPVLSLTMPTHHRRTQDSAQDALRLRNLVAEAAGRIDADPQVSRATAIALRAQLDRAVDEVDPLRALESLVLLVSTEEYQIWQLPRTAPERVVLSDTYLTRNLVAAKAQSQPYWALTIAADHAALWSGTADSVHLEEKGGFPLTAPSEAPNPQRMERIGDTPSTYTDEETRQFFRTADERLRAVLAADPRPLYLVGLPPALALLDNAGEGAHAAVGRVAKGAPADITPAALLAELGTAMEEHAERRGAEVRARLDGARGAKTFAGGLDEVWTAVQEGRAGLVVVEEHFQKTVRLTEGHLVPVGDEEVAPGDTTVREDVVDEIVEAALDSGAEVVFLPDDTLNEHHGIAAVLRY
ncbi:baeRF3 domain-containing protein [Streptomyces sp. NPDC002690]